MASLMIGAGQTLFAALAFSGSGFLFNHLDKSGYRKETERHNRAMEKLTRAKEKFYENEVRKKDQMERMRVEMADANADMGVTNEALRDLRTITFEGRRFDREPELSDFYKPSPEAEEFQLLTVSLVGAGAGYLAWRML